MTTNRPLRVFLCHSSNDKPAVRELYQKLRAEAWIEPWLDEEELYPGENWKREIEEAVKKSDAILVCLSNGSINKKGFVQKELRLALDVALEMPEGTVFIIPLRLEECTLPRNLEGLQYADYFEGQHERGLQRLLVSLKRRADSLDLKYEPVGRDFIPTNKVEKKEFPKPKEKPVIETPKVTKDKVENKTSQATSVTYGDKLTFSNGMEFMLVPAGRFIMGSGNGNDDEKPQHTVDISYDYWMAKFTITNEQYNLYCQAKNIKHPVSGWEKKNHPVVYVNWMHVMGCCQWLNDLLSAVLPLGLVLRLPTEAEWEKSARGTDGRKYPWGNTFDESRCNTKESGRDSTTSVDYFSPKGDSPYGCADMVGNVWEWTHSLKRIYPYDVRDGRENIEDLGYRVRRGGSFFYDKKYASCTSRDSSIKALFSDGFGFRVCLAPPIPK